MLSSVLRSERAIQVNIAIMRAFASLREWMSPHRELARRIEEMEGRYDAQFKVVFDAIRALTAHAADAPRERIGFRPTPIPAGRPDAPLSRPKARETIAA